LAASWLISISTGSGLAESATSEAASIGSAFRTRPAAQQVEGAVVGYPEQPGSKRRRLLQALQRHESPDERVLHDVLAVDDRSHETRAIAVQLGPQLAAQVLSIVKDKQMAPDKQKKLRELGAADFDFNEMSRLAMGRSWRSLSADQRQRFVPVFTSFLEDAYLNKLQSYSGQEIQITRLT
jgi:hypothetical protein